MTIAAPSTLWTTTKKTPLVHVFAQFDVPVGEVNEVFPTVVPVQAEVDLHKRPPFRAAWACGRGACRPPAACGWPCCVLHSMQEQTMFSHVVGPPRSRGMTWSRFKSLRSKTSPQYWQVFLSRSKMLCRVNLTSFFGSRSYINSRMMRGTRMRKEMVWTDSSCGALSERSRHSLKIEGAERAVLVVQDDLRMALKQQREGAAGGADVDRLPQPVQHQHVLV